MGLLSVTVKGVYHSKMVSIGSMGNGPSACHSKMVSIGVMENG